VVLVGFKLYLKDQLELNWLGKVHRWKIRQHSLSHHAMPQLHKKYREFELNFIAKAISVACMATRAVLAPSERTKIVFGRWGSSRRSPRPTSRLGSGIPPPHTPLLSAPSESRSSDHILALFSFHFEPWVHGLNYLVLVCPSLILGHFIFR